MESLGGSKLSWSETRNRARAVKTTLGPVVRTAAADEIRRQVAATVAAGARAVINEKEFAASQPGTPYLAPQVLLGVDHTMPVMQEEIFGPILPVISYDRLDDAVAHINAGPRPLALYWFGNSDSVRDDVLAREGARYVASNPSASAAGSASRTVMRKPQSRSCE